MIHRLTAPVVLPADPECSVIRDGAVDIDEHGRITYCGPASEAPATAATTTAKQGILLPGLVNTHAHSPMVLLRGMGGDLPLLRWLREVIWPTEAKLQPADVHAGMVLGSVEMLRRGVTTSAEMYFHAEQLADAVLTTGARGVIGGPIIDLPGLDWRALLADASKWIDADGLRFGPGERIELSYAGHSAYMLPPEALGAIADEAAARDALVQIHVAEAADEDAAQRSAHGSVPKLLDEVGLLRGRIVAAHAVHLSDEDITLLADRGAGVAHCPGSNAKLASGIARLADLRAANIRIGLGTDGPSSNDDLDLWEEVQLSAMLARLAEGDATALTASAALLLATRGGADALGRDDIGALEPGRWADVVHVDVDDPAFATGLDVPDDQLLGNLVWAAGSRRVRDVWVAGEQVVADGESSRVDRGRAQADVAAAAQRLRTT
ncbi:Cytosine/adenosine deaminase [Prauserella aidingensis]|uniref:amidohydrolase family protein n=1 Tax=Prauserella aidingensis TaxID=387890 RepID=UPI0020A32183|nr:amidohydrolase family protein [Prauserella aidingensis]MCP2255122.1 Cytosine/adenosine deaminase [Prauserella aidingensis]